MIIASTSRSFWRPSFAIFSRHHPCSRTIYTRTSILYGDAKSLPYHLVVGLPALSPTMQVGTLSEWYLKEGDSFSAGDAIAKIETDKASMDFEAQDDGVVAKILVKAGEGDDLNVGTPIMVTVEDVADVPAFANYVSTPDAVPEMTPVATLPPKPESLPPAVSKKMAGTIEPPKPVVVANVESHPPEKPVGSAPTSPPLPIAVATTPSPSGSALLATSPLAKRMAKQQLAYLELYGATGYKPILLSKE